MLWLVVAFGLGLILGTLTGHWLATAARTIRYRGDW